MFKYSDKEYGGRKPDWLMGLNISNNPQNTLDIICNEFYIYFQVFTSLDNTLFICPIWDIFRAFSDAEKTPCPL
jgi:hypothetical protein